MVTRNPEATKRRILDAALHEFAAHGIAGARVDTIAARAQINKRMLYHYFGSKEGLYQEILSSWTRELVERQASKRPGLRDQLGLVNADRIRMLMWEALELRQPDDRLVNAEQRRTSLGARVERTRAEQAAGRIRPDIDAAQLLLSEMFMVVGALAFPQLVHLMTGYWPEDPEFAASQAEFLERFERALGEWARPESAPEPG